MRYIYDLHGAAIAGIHEHPQRDVEKRGIKVTKFEGNPMYDCVLMETDKPIDPLPTYIKETHAKFTEA